jgi:hypothetical protein
VGGAEKEESRIGEEEIGVGKHIYGIEKGRKIRRER